jgi:hypothetical protein
MGDLSVNSKLATSGLVSISLLVSASVFSCATMRNACVGLDDIVLFTTLLAETGIISTTGCEVLTLDGL